MAKKKTQHTPVSQQDNEQAQQALAQYHSLANDLRTITALEQIDSILNDINNLPESVQLALLKALGKEQNSDAADLLAAIYEYSPIKNVRKEARRSLIQLEGSRVYPDWRPPVQQPAVLQFTPPTIDTPLPFWKGFVTDSMAVGEVSLALCFEDGRSIRLLSFLLDFWGGGVKDFFTRIESKHSIERFIQHLAELYSVPAKLCSLEEGRRLLLDALAVNKKFGVAPGNDYTRNLQIVEQLVLHSPDLEELLFPDIEEDEFDDEDDEDDEDDISSYDTDPQEVVYHFLESLDEEIFETAYELLAHDSPLRQELSVDDWVELREDWADAVDSGKMELYFVHEREQQQPKIWLPNLFSAARSSNKKVFDVAWSLEFDDVPDEETRSETAEPDETSSVEEIELARPLVIPPELPYATAIYAETGRHWFWASYTLAQEQDRWRIFDMSDEGKQAENLSIDELRKRNEELDKRMKDVALKYTPEEIKQFNEQRTQEFLDDLLWRYVQALHHDDALIKKLPLDQAVYKEAAARSLLMGEFERCLVYLDPMIERFADLRAANLRQKAALHIKLRDKYNEARDDERAERAVELATQALRKSLTLEDNFDAQMKLAELLVGDEEFDEAQTHLQHARELATEVEDEAYIEYHLGEIAVSQGRYADALQHYQRTIELKPEDPLVWLDLAKTQQQLNNAEAAEMSFRRAIELAPDSDDAYFDLSNFFKETGRLEEAIEALEDGLEANPDSAALHTFLAVAYYEHGDHQQAEIFLNKAEQLDPDFELLPDFRQLLEMAKLTRIVRQRTIDSDQPPKRLAGQKPYQPGKPLKFKKKKNH